MARLRVLFFTNRLGGGGAEMQLVRVANHLDRADFDVEIAVCRGGGEYEARARPGTPIHHLSPALVRSSTASLLVSGLPLRRLVRKREPDVVCAFMDPANVIAATAIDRSRGSPRVVGCVQNAITKAYAGSVMAPIPWLARRTYPRLDAIIALSHGVAGDLVGYMPAVAPLVRVIHNAGLDDDVLRGAAAPIDGPAPDAKRPLIVACGRLAHQKGYGYLLDAFARVHRTTAAHLWIVGEGPERRAIEQQLDTLGLRDAVRLLGFQKNPYPYMAAADVFVLSSLYEGFGNVLVEAMACGAAVVSTDCPHGPNEIITDGVDGILVPVADAPALADGMLRVLADPALRARLRDAGRARARSFHVSSIAGAYARAFRELAS